MKEALLIGVSYLLGAIPFGLILVRIRLGKDIRSVGSGNIGATNVARLSWKLGAVTLLLDALKGLLPVLVARVAGVAPVFIAACGLAAFLGHLFPVYLRFKGGKGVATGLGVVLGVAPIGALAALGAYMAAFAITRISSAGSLCGALALPVALALLGADTMYLVLAAVLVLLVLVKHKENIRRLCRGEEKRS